MASIDDIRIPWVDLYLRAIDLRCGKAFSEPLMEALDFVMELCREEIEHPTGLVNEPAPVEDDAPSAPFISFEGGMARMVYPDGPE